MVDRVLAPYGIRRIIVSALTTVKSQQLGYRIE